MNTKILSVSISLALLCVASSASAELIIDDGARKPAIQAAPQVAPAHTTPSSSGTGFEWRRYGAPNGLSDQSVAARQAFVTQSGSRPSHVSTAGWAKDMPLSFAVRQVVPADFEVKENGVSLTKMASWSGDRPWDQTLETLSQQGGFVSHIDWSKKQVSLAPRLPASAPASHVAHVPATPVKIAPAVAAPVKPKSSAVTISETVSPQFVAATRPIAPPAAQWVLSPSMTLRENVESWAKKAGWSVVWEAADYPIIASANFSGEFASSEGPLAKLIGAYESSDQPLVANLTTMDRVVYVKNKFHERTQVVPTSPIEMTPTN